MTDIPELDRIANTPGYGTGAAFRNKAAAAQADYTRRILDALA